MLRFYQACRVIPLRELLLAGALAGLVAAPAGAADKIVIRGSDTIGAKLMPQLAEEFAQQKQAEGVEISFEIAAEGSSQGIAAVIDGTADIGMSSREARDTEISRASARGVENWNAPAFFTGRSAGSNTAIIYTTLESSIARALKEMLSSPKITMVESELRRVDQGSRRDLIEKYRRASAEHDASVE